MKNIKYYFNNFNNPESKINLSERSKTILASIISSVLVFIILSLIVYANRAQVFRMLAGSYIGDGGSGAVGANTTSGGTLPAIFSDESLVTAAVKKTNPAVVSIIISKEVPN